MIKILIGGSPCTFWSIAQKNNRETEAEGLGWELFKNYLIAKEKLTFGGQDFTLFDKRVIIRRAIERKASSLILVHNHPSGNPYPSVEDINQTKDLHRAMSSCGLQLLDHVIVAGASYYSFSDEQVVRGSSARSLKHVSEKF